MLHTVIAVVVILVALCFPLHALAKARAAGAPAVGRGTGTKRAKGASPAGIPSARQSAKQAAATIWTTARATDWLEQQRHHRENGTTPPPGKAIRAAKAAGRAVRKLRGAAWPAPKPSPAQPAGGTSPPPAPAAPPARPQTTPPASTNGRTAAMPTGTSTGSAEKLIEGVNHVQNEALSGAILAKHRSVKAANEGAIRFADMAQMLSRVLAERHYGPEITEPLSAAGTHMRAAAQALSQTDAALHSLINSTIGDSLQSGRQIPDRAELSETGRH